MNWRNRVVYPVSGAQPQVLADNDKYKVIVGGLEVGQKIPVHPEAFGIYIFLEGNGVMTVDEDLFSVEPGETVIVPDGAKRGIEATTRLAFIAIKII
jgi:mannose-6-phosphate isomerase-like protein (cupin superfamily)